MSKKIGATQFKAQCLALLERLPDDGLIVTKHGKMVARVIPYRDGNPGLIGSLADKITIDGDLESTGVAWNVDDQS